MSFQCLGSWAGDNGETYMSLLDTQLPQLDEDPRPRYRCAVSNSKFSNSTMSSYFKIQCLFCNLSGSNILQAHIFHTWWQVCFVKDVTNFLNGIFFALACKLTYLQA